MRRRPSVFEFGQDTVVLLYLGHDALDLRRRLILRRAPPPTTGRAVAVAAARAQRRWQLQLQLFTAHGF